MFLLKKLLAAWLLPPMGLVIVGFVGLVLCQSRRRRLGLALAAIGLAGIACLSLPIVAYWLMKTVAIYPPLRPGDANGAEAIVVLGGGVHGNAPEYGDRGTVSLATLGRLRYGAYLAKQNNLPILVSGGHVLGSAAEAPAMAAILTKEFGVPVKWVEAESRDTEENAAWSAKILKNAGISRIVLVSQAFHLRRATSLFQAQGLVVTPAPTLPPEPHHGVALWLPSSNDLEMSCVAIKEWTALVLIRIRAQVRQ